MYTYYYYTSASCVDLRGCVRKPDNKPNAMNIRYRNYFHILFLGCNIAYTKTNNEITNYNVTHGLKLHTFTILIIVRTYYTSRGWCNRFEINNRTVVKYTLRSKRWKTKIVYLQQQQQRHFNRDARLRPNEKSDSSLRVRVSSWKNQPV